MAKKNNNNNGEKMSVKTKLILIITISFAVFYTAIAIIIAELIHEKTDEYYKEWIVRKKKALSKIISEEFKSLSEGYYYIDRYNISPKTVIATHDYTSIVHYAPNGDVKIIYTNPYSNVKFDESDAGVISQNAKTTDMAKKGFCYHNGKLYMLISFPIFKKGKYEGYMAIIKRVDERYLDELKNILTVDVVEYSEIRKEVKGEVSEFIPLNNTSGIPVGYLRIAYIGIIDPLIAETYNYFLIVSAVILFTSIIISSTIINRAFFSRVAVLSNFMKNIGKRGFRTGERIMISGDDEIKDLADSINMALDEIERSKKEISGMAENLRVINRILRHDILNDLAVIQGFAEVASEKRGCEYCPRIMDRAEKAVDTIKKLKNVEMALSESELHPMKISRIIRDVMRVYDIEWELIGDAEVLVDDGIYSVFDNLVSNAIKHGKTDRIKFEVKKKDGMAIIRVTDYGEGIPDSIKQRIFEEGFTLGDGSGLGLYIVKKLVEKYGGSIAVSDNRPSGTIFTIKLKTARKQDRRE